MSAKITEWFDPEVSPIHIGWYEREWDLDYLAQDLDWWNGQYWEYGAGNGLHQGRAINDKRWRGLAEKP